MSHDGKRRACNFGSANRARFAESPRFIRLPDASRTRLGRVTAPEVVVRPLTPSRWDDLLELFGERGAYSGCWCMFFRRTASEFEAGSRNRGARNREEFEALVMRRRIPGLLAYKNGRPVGWSEFGRLARSPVAKPVDDEPKVWSVVCFYIDRHHRGKGVGTALLRAAVDYAAQRGARIIEGYPVDPHRRMNNAEAFHGLASMFEAAGFREVVRRSPIRPVMRLKVAR
jgi:GNAT superfamily N-acetyltransferase